MEVVSTVMGVEMHMLEVEEVLQALELVVEKPTVALVVAKAVEEVVMVVLQVEDMLVDLAEVE